MTPIEQLAMILFARVEHLDPGPDYDPDKTALENWAAMGARRRSFYEHCIRRLGIEMDLWRTAFPD